MDSDKEKRLSDVIREVIGALTPAELSKAKPSKVLPGVEAAGFEITPSVRSTVSKLLKKMKAIEDLAGKQGKIIGFPEHALQHHVANRTDLAMKLVEACGGDFSLVRAEIDRLEKFAKAIKGA